MFVPTSPPGGFISPPSLGQARPNFADYRNNSDMDYGGPQTAQELDAQNPSIVQSAAHVL